MVSHMVNLVRLSTTIETEHPPRPDVPSVDRPYEGTLVLTRVPSRNQPRTESFPTSIDVPARRRELHHGTIPTWPVGCGMVDFNPSRARVRCRDHESPLLAGRLKKRSEKNRGPLSGCMTISCHISFFII